MRKLLVVLVLALAVPAAAVAAAGDRGDGTLVVKGATGRLAVTAKGTLLGRVADGQIVVSDLTPGATTDVQVFGYDQKPQVRPNGATVYRGSGLRFRILDGWYTVVVTGVGINLSAVGSGQVQGQGISAGLFSTDGLPFAPALKGVVADAFGEG